MRKRVQIEIKGIVQGVGFRPFVYQLAKKHALSGYVCNDTRGVDIEVEGEGQAITDFLAALQAQPPPLAQLESLHVRNNLSPLDYNNFSICHSSSVEEKFVLIPPDIATCENCLEELFDSVDRRYRYTFINCTHCGPRFTIIKDIPYDREKTTMSVFSMCEACEHEYHSPANRRFHAQPSACPACGPQIFLTSPSGDRLDFSEPDAISEALKRLECGDVLAIKGIGGFHLACNGLNVEAVARLRRKKHREDKPFALMASDVAMIREYCHVSDVEEVLLRSARRPIVLLRKRPECRIPEAVAPNLKYLGFMLPYTPLHHLLLRGYVKPLVMTSGNLADEPIAYQNDDSCKQLRMIADCFLTHDREIHIRCDDSIARIFRGQEYIVRRSRGYVPDPIKLSFEFNEILACGAELKSTFCLTHKNYAFVSHHIGDLENLETLRSFQEGIEHFKKLFYLKPEVVVYDLHPEYLSTKYALSLEESTLRVGVQHHHAHVASCMADNNLEGEVIGVAMDGLGYGADGHFWGSEFFVARWETYERICHLEYVPMPGAVKAIKEPWRMAGVYLRQAFGESFLDLNLPFVKRLNAHSWKIIEQMIAQGINSPLTCGMGRLIDAVSSLLGLKEFVNYEGEAAIKLETIADESCTQSYWFDFGENGSVIQTEPVIKGIVQDMEARIPAPIIAAKFHNAIADVIVRVAARVREQHGLKRVVLSGGVFQNVLLLERTCQWLEARGFDVYTHHRVPPNDGGISLGQAVIANAKIKAKEIY